MQGCQVYVQLRRLETSKRVGLGGLGDLQWCTEHDEISEEHLCKASSIWSSHGRRYEPMGPRTLC